MTYESSRDMYRDHMTECLIAAGKSRGEALEAAYETYPECTDPQCPVWH